MATTAPEFALDLRPLSLGELLDRTFVLYRRNFLLFLGISAPPHLLTVALNLALFSSPAARALGGPFGQPGDASSGPAAVLGALAFSGGIFLVGILGLIVYAIVLGATTYAVSDIYLGRRCTVPRAYSQVRKRILGLVDLIFSLGIRAFGIGFLTLLIFAMAVGLMAAVAPVAALAFGIIAGMGAGFLFFHLMLRYGVAVPAQVLENLRARQAIKRSIELTKGRLGGLFVLFVLMVLVTLAIILAIQGPAEIAILLIRQREQVPLWLVDLNILLGGIGQSVAGPLLTIALVHYYYDLRIRKEALDLQVMMSALETAAPPADAAPALS